MRQKSYSAQIERADDYKKPNPTFFIGILDFEATQNPSYINRHKITDVETGENFIKDIEFNFIELPKFKKTASELTTIVDQWVYFIKNAESLDVIPYNVKDEGLKHAYNDVAKHNWTKRELEAYDYVFMREQDERGRWELATRREVEKATKEAQKFTVEKVAKRLLDFGLSIEDVAKNTGLTIEQVQALITI